MLAACAGSCCLYIIFIATSFQTLINYELNVNWDVRYYIAVTVLPCIALGEIRKLKNLVPFSAISNVCIVITFATTLWYIFDGPMDISERPIFSGWENLPLFFRWFHFHYSHVLFIKDIFYHVALWYSQWTLLLWWCQLRIQCKSHKTFWDVSVCWTSQWQL